MMLRQVCRSITALTFHHYTQTYPPSWLDTVTVTVSVSVTVTVSVSVTVTVSVSVSMY